MCLRHSEVAPRKRITVAGRDLLYFIICLNQLIMFNDEASPLWKSEISLLPMQLSSPGKILSSCCWNIMPPSHIIDYIKILFIFLLSAI